MSSFYFFLIFGLILISIEIVTTTFYLLVIGAAFILASLFALKFDNWTIVVLLAVLFTFIGTLLVKLYKRKHNNNGKMSVEHIGQLVEVVEVQNGMIRVLYSGSYWNARLKGDTTYLPQIGDKLKITKFSSSELEVNK
ncbi:MAG: NfeD family protein [Proteobacteria bacterium]|jgi:membrane protein implicated in regulation of membrane protease activity|nr:NfeD family protein [Pseudomonadota bacterium]